MEKNLEFGDKMHFQLRSDLFESISAIKKFFGTEHVLGKNEALLRWMYGNSDDSFNISLLRFNSSIIAILAYIPSERFDKKDLSGVLWGSLWAADKSYPGAGSMLLRKVISSFPELHYQTLGISSQAELVYKSLGFEISSLNHFYISREPNTLFPKNKLSRSINLQKECFLPVSFEDIHEFLKSRRIFFGKRSIEYIQNRFNNHPVFKYEMYSFGAKPMNNLMIGRAITQLPEPFFRVLEFIHTDETPNLSLEISEWLSNNQYDFLDFYCYGTNRLEDIGWLPVSKFPGKVFPHLVDPPVFTNVDLKLVHNTKYSWVTRSDGDQDRPNT